MGKRYPQILVRSDRIVLTYCFPDDRPDRQTLKKRIDQDVEALSSGVARQAEDVLQHNERMGAVVRSSLERKRENALTAIDAVASLGIPMKKRSEPATYVAPTERRKFPKSLPDVTDGPFEPEPTLHQEEYEHILRVLRSMSLVIERNPSSFARLKEELIRDLFLVQLNGHYEGTATGETFNASGKTDILIRVKDRNIFIAECKFWNGPKVFDRAISQLLDYLSWRDSKSAIMVFNRTRNSSAVRAKMHEVVSARKEHRKTEKHSGEGDSRYILVKESDRGREIVLTTMLFDMPGPGKDESPTE